MEGDTRTAADGTEERRLELAPRPDSPRLARAFVAEALRAWRSPWWDAPAELVVSELVTNAIRHAGTRLVLRCVRTAQGLTIAVDDESGGDPHVVPTGQRGDGGLGLAIVDRLADEWGVTEHAHGKTVWARLAGRVPAGNGSGALR